MILSRLLLNLPDAKHNHSCRIRDEGRVSRRSKGATEHIDIPVAIKLSARLIAITELPETASREELKSDGVWSENSP